MGQLQVLSNLALVLLGFRLSLPSILRDLLIHSTHLDRDMKKEDGVSMTVLAHPSYTLADITRDFPPIPTIAAHLTFCSGNQTIVLEKDLTSAKVFSSTDFISVTDIVQLSTSNTRLKQFASH
ncbi:hypothetical protein CC80DRAFT_570611 [Byssothecium circinans]|uniref:Uncharacterized protein n=1 Tax=Byssothecium circinans TaxID=147558 RepID=A0A6A5UE40_9PLEO|nr:hypothetical protein CC80DRAFT_570611 [Byssothecium circinans]